VERRVEDRDVRHVGQQRSGRGDRGEAGGLCSGAERADLLDGGEDVVVDEHRRGEALAAVHHPVADADEARRVDGRHDRREDLLVAGAGQLAGLPSCRSRASACRAAPRGR
jgi:hypothetical protein